MRRYFYNGKLKEEWEHIPPSRPVEPRDAPAPPPCCDHKVTHQENLDLIDPNFAQRIIAHNA